MKQLSKTGRILTDRHRVSVIWHYTETGFISLL